MDRLEALRSLERMVTDDQGWGDIEGECQHGFSLVTLLSLDGRSDQNAHWAHRAFDGSLDAAKSLHEAALTDWRYQIDNRHTDEGATLIGPDKGKARGRSFATVKGNPARAWLLAIVGALISIEEAGNE